MEINQSDTQSSAMEDLERIKGLCKMEAEVINMMFEMSEEYGLDMLMNSTLSFEKYLRSQNKMFIRSLSIEYRTFVVTLLTLIDERYRAKATAKMIMS